MVRFSDFEEKFILKKLSSVLVAISILKPIQFAWAGDQSCGLGGGNEIAVRLTRLEKRVWFSRTAWIRVRTTPYKCLVDYSTTTTTATVLINQQLLLLQDALLLFLFLSSIWCTRARTALPYIFVHRAANFYPRKKNISCDNHTEEHSCSSVYEVL